MQNLLRLKQAYQNVTDLIKIILQIVCSYLQPECGCNWNVHCKNNNLVCTNCDLALSQTAKSWQPKQMLAKCPQISDPNDANNKAVCTL